MAPKHDKKYKPKKKKKRPTQKTTQKGPGKGQPDKTENLETITALLHPNTTENSCDSTHTYRSRDGVDVPCSPKGNKALWHPSPNTTRVVSENIE